MSTHTSGPSQNERKIVITGTGAICAGGNSTGEIWENLMSGTPESLDPGSRCNSAGERSISGSITVPALRTDIQPQLAHSMGKHLSLLLVPAEEAFSHAGLGEGVIAPEAIGFFAGMGMVDYHIDDLLPAVLKSASPEGDLDYEAFFSGGYEEIYPLWPLAMLNNVAFCQVAIHLGLRGENCVFSPHGDAGIQAVAEAVRVLREGKAEAALAGGISEEISALSVARAQLNGLSTGGAFLGEGGAMIALESLELAENRKAGILAAIAGYGFACEKSASGACPSTEAVVSAIEASLLAARVRPEDIDLLLFCAAGTHELNACEDASRLVFEGAGPVRLFPGRLLGETFAAGPIISTIIAAGIFSSEKIPFCLAPDHAQSGRVPLPVGSYRRALVVATSYEGRCASLVIEKI